MTTVNGMMKVLRETTDAADGHLPVDPYDNADYGSDSDAQSYVGSPTSVPPEVLLAFSQEELVGFETIYRAMAD